VDALVQRLRESVTAAAELVRWTASLPLPDDDQVFTCVALRHGEDYPITEGSIVSSSGLDIGAEAYEAHFTESHVAHSTALYSALHDAPYLVGPLARLNLSQDRLPDPVRDMVRATGITFPSRNMFHSVVARAVEIHYALLEAIRLLENYSEPDQARVAVTPRAGVGFGCTEAPRGTLWHRYETDARGDIVSAKIVPPTSQNQARIEQDLLQSLQAYGLQHSDDELRLRGEMVIRNYDPCISCATHFLRINVER
jgi:coenzyme F420-reducing hydrogenase alpha subunit